MEYTSLAARQFAQKWHGKQLYGDHPYIFHLIGVAKLVGRRNTYPELKDLMLSCAYLHDTLEDTEATPQLIQRQFGMTAAMVVQKLTKVKGESYEDYMNKVLSSVLAREIKLCDTMFNLNSSVAAGNEKRITKYVRQLSILVKGEYHD